MEMEVKFIFFSSQKTRVTESDRDCPGTREFSIGDVGGKTLGWVILHKWIIQQRHKIPEHLNGPPSEEGARGDSCRL